MKRNLRLLAVVIAVPIVIDALIWPLPEPWEPPVKSTFLGFTNGAFGPMALFSVQNIPLGPTPHLVDVAYQENGVWKSRGVTPGIFLHDSINTNVRELLLGVLINHRPRSHPPVTRTIVSLPVTTTNQPMRAVFKFPGQEISLKEAMERALDRIRFRSAKPNPPPPTRVRSLYFTNETVVRKAEDLP